MDTYEVDSVEWGSAAVTISNAADSIDSFVARLSASAASSTSSTRETCAQIIICVNQVREVFRAAATARKVRVLRWLGKQAEELDAVAKAWDACARVCALERYD